MKNKSELLKAGRIRVTATIRAKIVLGLYMILFICKYCHVAVFNINRCRTTL